MNSIGSIARRNDGVTHPIDRGSTERYYSAQMDTPTSDQTQVKRDKHASHRIVVNYLMVCPFKRKEICCRYTTARHRQMRGCTLH